MNFQRMEDVNSLAEAAILRIAARADGLSRFLDRSQGGTTWLDSNVARASASR